MPAVRAVIDDFLSCRRLAFVGVSRNSKDFSRALFRELKGRGYDLIPVNPRAGEIEGIQSVDRVSAINPPVEGALLLIPGKAAEAVVNDCAAAGVKRVWFYRAVGDGAVSPEALKACEENNIATVPGECPFMFLNGAGWIHGVHRFCRKLMGTLPQ